VAGGLSEGLCLFPNWDRKLWIVEAQAGFIPGSQQHTDITIGITRR
jgi:hypothetical protein